MKKKFGSNRQGSVLLAVVCMTLVCMALATMTLATVNATMHASNENVQKTQAKVTAEKVLTEFMSHYVPKSEGITNAAGDLIPPSGKEFYDSIYEKYIKDDPDITADDPYIVNVTMDGDDDFASNYGNVKIKIYPVASTQLEFKVEAECTFARKTETASVSIVSKPPKTNLPSNTLSATAGAENYDDVAIPVDGDVYIEKDNSSDKKALGFNNSPVFTSHFYTDYSLYNQSSGLEFKDLVNKNLPADTEEGKKEGYYHPLKDGSEYFVQAPTVTAAGYIRVENSGFKITTEVGKTNVDRKNSDDYANAYDYDSTELSNKDGYIYAMKKFVFNYNEPQIGSAGRPIDMYCRGAYFGPVPSKINGVDTDRGEIEDIYGTMQNEYTQRDYKEFYGNFYSYKGDFKDPANPSGALQYQNGDVVINEGTNDHGPTINGDCFIDGDLYLLNSRLTVTGTLYVTGKIYSSSSGAGTGNAVTDATAHIEWDSTANKYIVKAESGTFPSNRLFVGGLGNQIDRSKERNNIPADGYDPAQNKTGESRTGLGVYTQSSPNQMFYDSTYPNYPDGAAPKADGATLKAVAKNIADKYCEAMSRDLYSTYSDGNVSDVFEFDGGYKVPIINTSVRLTPDQVNGKFDPVNKTTGDNIQQNYLINLKDEDIVICLPAGRDEWGNVINKARFRITRSTSAGKSAFVYFMFYNPQNPNVCYYMSEGMSYTHDGFTCNGTNETATVELDAGNHKGMVIADYSVLQSLGLEGQANFADGLNLSVSDDELKNAKTNEAGASLAARLSNKLCEAKNYAMILVPDNGLYVSKTNNVSLEAIVYGPKADFQLEPNAPGVTFGRVFCRKFYGGGDRSKTVTIREVKEADGSLLDYVEYKNQDENSKNVFKIQYYQY